MPVVCLLGAVMLGVVLAAGAQVKRVPMHIQGRVRTSTGATLGSSVTVRLEREDGEVVAEQPADSDGAFYFNNLFEPRFRLIVIAEGFETHEETVEFPDGIHFAVCNIVLNPLPKDSGHAGAAEARSDSLAPRKAKKEYEKAAKDLAAQDLDEAETHLENAVKEYPCYARAQTHLATVLEARHDVVGAEAALRKAGQCDPDYISSYIVLGQMLNDQKRFAESETVLQEGMRRWPGAWQFAYQLGIAYFGLAQYSEAKSQYDKVRELDPSPPAELPLRLADVYLKEKDYQKVYSEMEQYLKAEPHGPFAEKVRGIMRQIEASGVVNHPQAAKQ